MKWLGLLAATALLVALPGEGKDRKVVLPYEAEGAFVARNAVDEAVLAALRARRIEPADPCSDVVFVRRVFLDVIGTLPAPEEVLGFLGDPRPDKRAALIESLLGREEFADYAAMRWCDWLRVKAEFPINLWPNAAQAYHRWIRDAIHENRPVDRVAREMLTSSGSNFRVPAVNFLRAAPSREPAAMAQVTALTFLGSRIEGWPEDRRTGLAAFFSRVAFKRTDEWKEEIVLTSPAPAGPIDAIFPDGSKVTIPPDRDPRAVLADWLVAPGNPWFARNLANRAWAWLLGRGIVHEPDDLRPDNPPSNPALLDLLAKELVLADFDLRHIYRLILSSSTYQQSCIPRSDRPEAEALFAHYPVRRLDAEVLIDALCRITGSTESYSSATPEPYTYVPEENRTITLPDGSITSPFLELFGRPSRDTGLWSERSNEPTDGQRLHLLNSSDVQRRIERSLTLGRLAASLRADPRKLIETIYLTVLSRQPTEAELAAIGSYFRSGRIAGKQALDDLVWALINSKEFLYRH